MRNYMLCSYNTLPIFLTGIAYTEPQSMKRQRYIVGRLSGLYMTHTESQIFFFGK